MIKIAKFCLNPKWSLGRNKQIDEFENFLNKIGEENIINIVACPEGYSAGDQLQTLYTVFYKEQEKGRGINPAFVVKTFLMNVLLFVGQAVTS